MDTSESSYTTPIHHSFADVDRRHVINALNCMKATSHPQSDLLAALSESPCPNILAEELCVLAQTPSITDLTVSLALLSESLCKLLSISPLPIESNRDIYLDLILTSGPDYDFERKGITLTLNPFLFDAIKQLRTQTSDGHRTLTDLP
ncbi:hypothetical protein [Litoribrevibacter albus]|uniref:Uncharacterized protein n=1 Tax=Litoribrevibacter albus TaxID=1473156 RepID=A0AA37SC20_9GAMM|nr:hypothetical protein [Litoribrevibacter albus]GLQ31743.1 hypothetical protein GCM10007876_22220 [Litoribrevibacter albus]